VNLAFFTFLAWSAQGPARERPRPVHGGVRSPEATRPARTVDVNINHALGHLEGELVAVPDADHVPLPTSSMRS
jgi:hypothetical protein